MIQNGLAARGRRAKKVGSCSSSCIPGGVLRWLADASSGPRRNVVLPPKDSDRSRRAGLREQDLPVANAPGCHLLDRLTPIATSPILAL